MKKTTIILAHSDYSNSIANKTIVDAVLQEFPDITVRNLGELYPDFNIDVFAEQDNLVNSDIIIFQFPVNWYNVPALLKQWLDKVLTHGFAYGTGGDKLEGKTLLVSCTAGGDKLAYTPIGSAHFKIDHFFHNLEATAYFCGMKYADPIFGFNYLYIPGVVNSIETVRDRAMLQADKLIAEIKKI